jgi:cystathionine beta-lyase
MSMAKPPAKSGRATRLVGAGRAKDLTGPFVNPPVVHASTVLFDTVEEMHSGEAKYVYGRRGTPTLNALADAIRDLEGAAGTVLCPSGLSAISTALLAFASAGDEVLLPDSIYHPGRHFADQVLSRLGVGVRYYRPADTDAALNMINSSTKIVYVESPGSYTMEMQDIPAIAEAAHRQGAIVIADNTWATPLFCNVLELGADVSVLAATKYISGHADVLQGTISANAEHWNQLRHFHGTMGLCIGPDDAYLSLRGLRTMEIRMERHRQSALAVANWLSDRPEISRVLYPALPDDPGHDLWRRDMSGSSGLFSFVFAGGNERDAAAVLDALKLFGLGYSWGGYESLATIGSHGLERSVARGKVEGPLVRLHIGLEDPDDLIADLDNALTHFRNG